MRPPERLRDLRRKFSPVRSRPQRASLCREIRRAVDRLPVRKGPVVAAVVRGEGILNIVGDNAEQVDTLNAVHAVDGGKEACDRRASDLASTHYQEHAIRQTQQWKAIVDC